MAENEAGEATEAAPAEAPAETGKPQTKVQGLLAQVAEQVKNCGPAVQERLIGAMVEKEVEDRKNLLDKALTKRFQLLSDLRKLDKPDVIVKNRDGSTQSTGFSHGKLEEIKKAQDPLDKLEAALAKALESNDFGKLKELVNK